MVSEGFHPPQITREDQICKPRSCHIVDVLSVIYQLSYSARHVPVVIALWFVHFHAAEALNRAVSAVREDGLHLPSFGDLQEAAEPTKSRGKFHSLSANYFVWVSGSS